MLRRILPWLAIACGGYFLYLSGISERGLVGPDEPRYAAVAREMAVSGDWITPRLWGEPWFEKPPLLYWIGAAAHGLGLGDQATRLPVALLSIAFLILFYEILRRSFGGTPAAYATAILGASTGWTAFSQTGVMDLPLAASLSAALLLLLPWIERPDERTRRALPWAAALLGVSMLAKGLVGPVLAALALIPAVVQRGWPAVKELLRPRVLLPFAGIGGAWYAACFAVNGWAFVEEFFWRHHLERFFTDSLRHEQPFWFFAPVLLAGLAPWTPLLLAWRPSQYRADKRLLFLAFWAVSTIVFFSISRNKLPGYVLPVLPPAAALSGVALANCSRPAGVLAASAALLGLLPAAEAVLPQALSRGLGKAWPPEQAAWGAMILVGATIPAVWLAVRRQRVGWAVTLLTAASVTGLVHLKTATFPLIDEAAGTRSLWRRVEPHVEKTCLGRVRRHVAYGLRYYSEGRLPDCSTNPRPYRVESDPPVLLGPQASRR